LYARELGKKIRGLTWRLVPESVSATKGEASCSLESVRPRFLSSEIRFLHGFMVGTSLSAEYFYRDLGAIPFGDDVRALVDVYTISISHSAHLKQNGILEEGNSHRGNLLSSPGLELGRVQLDRTPARHRGLILLLLCRKDESPAETDETHDNKMKSIVCSSCRVVSVWKRYRNLCTTSFRDLLDFCLAIAPGEGREQKYH
jgi:hypothetical protein